MLQIKCKDYGARHLNNAKVEWLLEYGKIRETVFFRGAIGDRYTIYVATKRNKNIVDIYTVYNTYSYNTSEGNHIATLDKNYVLKMIKNGDRWYSGCGNTLKQLMKQGICPIECTYDIRWCRSSYFLRFRDKLQGKILIEVSPWGGMKINLKTGTLVNKPPLHSRKAYKKAKAQDTRARKANYLANKNNKDALERYRKAGGDTKAARTTWINGRNVETADKSLETVNWDLIPMDDVFKHRNATLRSNIIEHYGMNAIIATLKYVIMDEDTIDGRKYRLLDVEIPDLSIVRTMHDTVETTHKGLYLEMLNPSTGESHFEGVANVGRWNSPVKATVKDALKWRDGDSQIRTGDINHGDNEPYIEPVILT